MEFQLKDSWFQVANRADAVIRLISCSVTDPKHLRSMIVRLACHAGNPQSVIQLAAKFRSLAIENQRAVFQEENARYSKLVDEKVALEMAKPAPLKAGPTVRVVGFDKSETVVHLPKAKAKAKQKAVGTTGTKAVGTKAVDTVGTKAVGTSVGTTGTKAVSTTVGTME